MGQELISAEVKVISGVVTNFTAPETIAKFSVERMFSYNSSIEIAFIAEAFKNWFWGKYEEPRHHESRIAGHELIEKSGDVAICLNLGNIDLSLTEIYLMLMTQPRGESKGPLLTNTRANIFYSRALDGKLKAIDIRRSWDGWHIFSYPLFLQTWPAGQRVFRPIKKL